MIAGIRDRGGHARRWMVVIVAAVLLASAGGWWALKQGRPWLYGVEAYVYGFPLIMMDLTKDAATAVPTAGEITAPANQFAVMTHYPDASFRAVVRTGLDTLFATAWADLDKEPLVLSVPDTNGRYYVIALFDMWSNVFASIGKRTTGTNAANFLIAVPAGVDTKTPPLAQVQKMDAGAYFGRLARLMKDNPPAAADAAMIEKLKTVGIEPGKDFDIAKLDPDNAKGMQRAMDGFDVLQKGV